MSGEQFPFESTPFLTMRLFRNHLFQRSVTCLLVAVMGAGLMSSQSRAEQDPTGFVSWVTLHVPGSIPASVELALNEADRAQPRSLDAFLDLFFSEIEKNQSEQEFMDWLYGDSSDHSVLRQDLRFRLLDVEATGLFWRSIDALLATSLQSTSRTSRTAKTSQSNSLERIRPHLSTGQLAISHAIYAVDARHLILVAEPQGP